MPTIKEPIVCCPNDPDAAKFLTEVSGTHIDEAFSGSCMTHIGHFRAAAKPTQTESSQSTQSASPKRPAHDLWAVLMACIYEVFPKLCPLCGGQMRIIAFITHSADIGHILEHIGAQTKPPRITPARGPPLWDGADAQAGEAVEPVTDWDEAAQTAPDFEIDQRVSC